MFDLDPRDYDSRDDERHGNTTNRGNGDAPTTAIAMTTGGNPTSDPVTRMTMPGIGRGPGNDRPRRRLPTESCQNRLRWDVENGPGFRLVQLIERPFLESAGRFVTISQA